MILEMLWNKSFNRIFLENIFRLVIDQFLNIPLELESFLQFKNVLEQFRAIYKL